MIGVFIFLCFLIIVAFFVIINLVKKVERYEDYIKQCEDTIVTLKERIAGLYREVREGRDYLKSLDNIGAFESDDEVGYFFKQLKSIQEALESFVGITYGEEESK